MAVAAGEGAGTLGNEEGEKQAEKHEMCRLESSRHESAGTFGLFAALEPTEARPATETSAVLALGIGQPRPAARAESGQEGDDGQGKQGQSQAEGGPCPRIAALGQSQSGDHQEVTDDQ